MSVSKLEEWCSRSLRDGTAKQPARPGPRAKLTVVILSYERQEFLLRQTVYWGNDAAKLVIVDGSAQPLSKYAQETLSTQPNIKYLHYPKSLTTRLALAASHIDTPYAVFLGDDEFLLKDGLSRAISKLESDPELVACIGQSLGFYLSKNGTVCTYGQGYPHWKYEMVQDDMRERLLSAMANYNAATCYAVLRAPVWGKSLGHIQDWSSPYAGEMQQALSTYIWGKLTTVDEVYWMRSHENAPVSTKGFNRKLLFRDWWLSPKFKSERERFVEILANEAMNTNQIGDLEARKMILESVEVFMEFLDKREHIQKASMSRVAAFSVGLKAMATRVLESVLPEKRARNVKAGLSRLLNRGNQGNLGGLSDLMRAEATGAFRLNEKLAAELSEIETLLSEFYRARQS